MKRRTYAELTAECERVSKQASVLHLALNELIRSKPAATQRVAHEGYRYVFRLYGAALAHGGLVTMTFYCKGQSPYTSANYLEDIARDYAQACTPESLAIRVALERLVIARNNIVIADHQAITP